MGRLLSYFHGSLRTLRANPAFRAAPFRTLVRGFAWLLIVAARRDTGVAVAGGEVTVPGRLRGAGASAIYVLREDYDPELRWLVERLLPGMVIVDGGANLGVYSVAASANIGGAGHVYAFEPAEVSFAYLARSAARAGNITAIQAALADTVGTRKLFHRKGRPNSFSLAPETDVDFETVEATTIDATFTTARQSRLDFVKLDVEGAEALALRGGTTSILAYRPVVIFEQNPNRVAALGLAEDDAWAQLAANGYRLHHLGDGQLIPLDRPAIGNNIALP